MENQPTKVESLEAIVLSVLIVTSEVKFKFVAENDLSRCGAVDPKDIHWIDLTAEADGLRGFRKGEEDITRILHESDIIHDRFVGILQVTASCAGNIPALGSRQGALILSFPEIQWVPIYGRWPDKGDKNTSCMTWKRALDLCRNGYSPLFDGDGLRSCLMLRVRNGGTCYARSDVALAVDEEANFAQMNAYTAYRFGYRAYSISSKAVADKLLRGRALELPLATTLMEKDLGDLKGFRTNLKSPVIAVFEDVQLQFPDDESKAVPQFGDLRDREYRLLNEAHLRVVATAARRHEPIAEMASRDQADGTEKRRMATVEAFFKNKQNARAGRYRSLSGSTLQERLRCSLLQLGDRLDRWWFNVSGAWTWHWLVKTLDALLMAGILIGILFWKASLFLPALLGVVIVQGVTSHILQVASGRNVGLPELVRKMLVRWSQWRFLPKRYRNHCLAQRVGKGPGSYWSVAHKPLAGIFGLRNACCLQNGRGFQGLYDTARVMEECRRVKQGAFIDQNDEDAISHAAPGMALEIAVRLLRRAEWLVAENKIIDAEGAIHGAVLATVAGELLDAKTPVVSIEALTWKQYFEIKAECEFVGVQAHPDMVDRYIDIHNAMRRICRSSDGTVREDLYNSGMAELMDKLSSLLSEKGKKEESLFFEKKARMFHRRLMNPMARNLLAYPEWLLRSAWHVVIGLMVLVMAFCAFWMFEIKPLNVDHSAVYYAYELLFCDEPNFADGRWGNYSSVLRTMRLIAMLHLAFLGLCFWDVMRKQ